MQTVEDTLTTELLNAQIYLIFELRAVQFLEMCGRFGEI